jgi:hypothetical protein
VTSRTARRIAGAVLFALASCNVYDPSLLGGGSGGNTSGGGPTGGGTGGTDSEDAGAGNGASAGTQTGGSTSGSGGMSGSSNGGTDNVAGEPPLGGEGGSGDTGGGGSASGGTTGGGGVGGATGGTPRGAGSGGTTGGGGSGGSGGNGGSGGSTSATGCAKLSVPMDAAGDKSHFLITLSSNEDLTAGTISVRFYVQAGAAGSILPYVQDPNYAFFGRPAADLSSFSGWSTINWDVGAQAVGSNNINKSTIKRVGVEITAYPASTGWSNPTIVYLDSITVKTTSFTFDATASVSTTSSSSDQSGQVLWFNSGSSDSTATGVPSWQATCP